LTKDLETFYLNQIQTLTDKNIKLIEKHTTTKNTELLKA
ncbi:ribosome recycling factor, partial ['Chrysanthemum coronarium' phytoplasma]